jgi:flagellar hook protein FlgE
MMRSMFSGVSGLRAHQTMMDVVGNNIANVNTAGFKASQVTFQEALNQTIRGASGSGTDRGGTNPMQIGLGVQVASIEGIFTQGAVQITGRNTDLAIQGDGFFMVQQGAERLYTRAGSFNFDEDGNLVNSSGLRVLGWTADNAGNVDTQAAQAGITLPLGQTIEPTATSNVELGGNLSSDTLVGGTVTSTITIYDSQGRSHQANMTFTKTAANAWDISGNIDGTAMAFGGAATASIAFNGAGDLITPASGIVGMDPLTLPGGTAAIDFDLQLNGANAIQQYGGQSTAEAVSQNGQAIGFLRSFAIADDGSITGQFSNGENRILAQVAIATFNNPVGLQRVGNSNYSSSVNSGEPIVGTPGSGNRGLLTAGSIEMSNVDLAREFTGLIIAQRGFQANSRIITTSDEMLNELVNLKR